MRYAGLLTLTLLVLAVFSGCNRQDRHQPYPDPYDPYDPYPRQHDPYDPYDPYPRMPHDPFNQEHAMKAELLAEHNRIRRGMKVLVNDAELDKIAGDWAKYMAERRMLTHKDRFGRAVDYRCRHLQFRYYGENIAYGYNDVRTLMDAWMNSRDHQKNIENLNFTHIGVGIHRTPDGVKYICIVFAG